MNREKAWNLGIQHCRAYIEEHHDLKCSTAFVCDDGFKLGQWISRKRCLAKKGMLSQERMTTLEQLGVFEEKPDRIFELTFSHLVAYKEQNANLDIPMNYVCNDGFRLGYYTLYLRRAYAGSIERTLTGNQIDQLNQIGFIWSRQRQKWLIGYEHAKQFWSEYHHLAVSLEYRCNDGYNLGKWVIRQRLMYNKDTDAYCSTYYHLLSDIGMLWTSEDFSWLRCYLYAKEIYDMNGCIKMVELSNYRRRQLIPWIQLCTIQLKKQCLNNNNNHLIPLYREPLIKILKGAVW